MKVELVNNFGICEELALKNMVYNISIYMSCIRVTVNSELVNGIRINREIFSYEINDNIIVIPCLFTIENICIIEINYNNENLRYTLKYDKSIAIDIKIIESLGDFHRRTVEWIGEGRFNIDELTQGIEDGKINLLQMLDPLTGFDNESFLKDIKNTIPFALNICTTPRQHLRVEDEILDIELVKNISPASLKHLASHSEHWKAKTIKGLVPSRMLAQVYEDDINIYENIFFRIAIEKILVYIGEKDTEVKKALVQKNSLIDWEQYGNMLSDYKRGEMLRKLLPDYNFDEEDFRREEFKELITILEKLEKGLSSIISTSFYQSINRFKNIQFPIQPTNIIKMDNRYNELFKLWNKMVDLKLNDKKQYDLTGDTINDINYYYLLYVQVLLVYGLDLLGLKKISDSYIDILDGGLSKLEVGFYNNNFDIRCHTDISGNFNKIRIDIIEKINMRSKYPEICELVEEIKPFIEICEIDPMDSTYIIFKKKPSIEYERQINNIFKTNREYTKKLSSADIKKLDRMDREWRKFFGNIMINFKEAKKFSINVYPILASLGEDEIDLRKNTKMLLDSVIKTTDKLASESNIFVMPTDLYKFEKIENNTLINRLINYGESYDIKESSEWGSYRVGIIPISQTEINSTQRLIKLLSIHLNRLAIEWGLAEDSCPLCQSSDIIKRDQNTWECRNHDCGILWGTTRCSKGCGELFSWIRPAIGISKSDIQEINPLKLILKKEVIFDRLTITDFDFIQENEIIKYVPKCPKCGCSSAKNKD